MPNFSLSMKRLVLAAAALAPVGALAQPSSAPHAVPVAVALPEADERGPLAVQAVRLAAAPRIDGALDDAAWQTAPAYDGFRRVFRREGEPSGQRTVVRFAYDDAALYVAAWLYDTAPDSISSRLFRRDDGSDGESDRFIVFLDTFHDRRTAYGFGVNAAGSLLDVTYTDDRGNGDGSWDGVWEGKAGRFAGGWTVEMRLPFSQLRFGRADVQTWGVNAMREVQRTGEMSMLRYLREDESGFVSRFAELRGLAGVRPGRGVEAVPYVTSRLDVAPAETGDPFFDGTRAHLNAGLDVRARVASNLTLSATVNPDFGQVEVDPAEVNLTAFETFYSEKRPFFVEGSSTFDFGAGPGDNNGWNWTTVDPFYSRRIGRAPQGVVPRSAFADVPESARILGAGKLTGRVGRASVGVLSAVAARTFARVLPSAGADERRVEVEPLAHYGVVRVLRPSASGQRGLGLLATAANRAFDAPYAADANVEAAVNRSAYTAGIDGWQAFDHGRWILKGWALASQVNGTAERLAALQRSSAHYLQRPDRDGFRYDASRTALAGWGGRVQLVRNGAPWFGSVALGAISPTLDLNDLGFMSRTDLVNGHVFAGQQVRPRTGPLQSRLLMAAVFANRTFDGDWTTKGFWSRAEVQTRSFWNVSLGLNLNADALDPYRTRGGPLMVNKGGVGLFASASTDSRKPWQLEFDLSSEIAPEINSVSVELGLAWQPGANLRVSVGPELFHSVSDVQWVRNQPDAAMAATYGTRHVFSTLDQWQANANVRVNWTFSPTLSLQVFAQPLVASGNYSAFKELARPRAYAFNAYAATEADGRVTVDPDGAGATPAFSFANPDFRIASLRGNAVLRWEYRPGSTLFLVWTQSREGYDPTGTFELGPAARQLFDADAEHVFAVKATYWIGR